MMSRTLAQRHDFIDFDDRFEQEDRDCDDDSFEENIRTQLLQFRSGTEREIILEPMSIDKRKIVHYIATNCSLKSHSIGGRGNRRVVVTRFPHVDLCTYTNARDSEPVVLNISQKQIVSQFLTTFPLGYGDIDSYLRSGIATRHISGRFATSFKGPMLVPPRTSVRPVMEHIRRSLPTYAKRDEILKAVREHKVTVIVGGTGCGKTTQVPQFLLEDAAERNQKVRIFCTQPRRLPVLAVSARVAKERNEKLGATVGYHIRLEQKISDQTLLTYCTSGVLLRLLTNDANARNISHIILDEIHEREQKTDYLLIALRQALKCRNDLRIILMSATMEDSRELFKQYFGSENVFCLEIPSTLHRVETFYLPEILALTDYKHTSSFTGGNCFGKTARSLNDNNTDQTFNSFPHVDEFRSENYDDSKFHFQRNGKKKGASEISRNFEKISSRRAASFAGTVEHYSPAVNDHFDGNKQLCPQHPGNGFDSKNHHADRNGQANLTEMYNKMSIANDEQTGYYKNAVAYDGYQMYQSQSAVTGLNYTQPPPNFAYHPQMHIIPYVASPPYCGQQVLYYPIMQPTHNDNAQHYYTVTPNTHDYTQHQPPKFYIATDNADGFVTYNNPYMSQGSSTQFHSPSFTPGCKNTRQAGRSGYYVPCLRDRPPHFDPSYVEVLRRTKLDTVYLVDSYMISGGEQWSESVDTDLTVAVISYCMDSPIHGSILVFLPGYEDILAVREKVMHIRDSINKPAIFTLHSQMGSQDQQRVFEPVALGYRKVILSTNIAEASLTIDDVVFVIDCGKVKEKNYDHSTRVSQLKMIWIAKSNAKQRAGRAGRCRNGYCFRLFTAEDYARMNSTQLPEMKRSAIHEVCLHAKLFAPENTSVRHFLLSAPEPPSPMAIDSSLEFLEQIGALFKNRHESSQMSHLMDDSYFVSSRDRDTEPDLTDLGRHIAQLPLDPQLARFLLFGICLKCLSPVLTLVAALSHREPFVLPPSGEREERNAALMARDIFAGFDYSDHMTLLRAVNAFAKLPFHSQSHFCAVNYLSLSVMRMIVGIRQQLFVELQRLRLVPSDCRTPEDHDLNRYCNSWPMIQAAIVAGSYPGIGFTRAGGQMRKIRTSNEVASLPYGCAVKRQASSAGTNGLGDGKQGRIEPIIEYLAFQELSKTGDTLSLRTVTAVPPLTVLLFAGPVRLKREVLDDYSIGDEFALNDDADTDSNTEECVFALEPWLVFRWKFEDMQLMLKLRVKLMTYFLSVMKEPDCQETEEVKELLATINQILVEDHRRAGFAECNHLPPPRPRSPTYVNNEPANDRRSSHHHRQQLPSYSEDRNEKETVGGSYLTVRNYRTKQWNGGGGSSVGSDSRVDFCGGPGIQSVENSEDPNENGRLSDRPLEENSRDDSSSNELAAISISPPLPLTEDEQVPEDPCSSTVVLEEETTTSRQPGAAEIDADADHSEDVVVRNGEVVQEGNSEEVIERREDRETPGGTDGNGPAPMKRSHFIPYYHRPSGQRGRRVFSRQFVNKSRPQAMRPPADASEEEEQQRHRDSERVGRRRENHYRDLNREIPQGAFQHERWRRNSPIYRFGTPGTHRMPRAYFRGGGRPDRCHPGSQRGRRAPRKEGSSS